MRLVGVVNPDGVGVPGVPVTYVVEDVGYGCRWISGFVHVGGRGKRF